MKKIVVAVISGLLCLMLAGCGGGGAKQPFDPAATVQALLDAPGVFTEDLERLDREVLDQLYGLEDREVAQAVSWYSPGGTAEEATVLLFESETAAAEFMEAAWGHIADQKEANESYRPQELPKLEKAVVERRGTSLLVLVAADYDAAEKALEGLE